MHVTSFSVFHTEATMSIGLKNIFRMVTFILQNQVSGEKQSASNFSVISSQLTQSQSTTPIRYLVKWFFSVFWFSIYSVVWCNIWSFGFLFIRSSGFVLQTQLLQKNKQRIGNNEDHSLFHQFQMKARKQQMSSTPGSPMFRPDSFKNRFTPTAR